MRGIHWRGGGAWCGEKLWGEILVDFEEGLNTGVTEVARCASADSAANPRFNETLPRRGYRFIACGSGRCATGSGPRTITLSTKFSANLNFRVRDRRQSAGLLS
jgi:hypothetical protein